VIGFSDSQEIGGAQGMENQQIDGSSFEGLQRLLEGESGDSRALAHNLEDNPICTVSYDASVPCLVVRWRRHATSAQIRYIHECLIRLITKYRVRKILGDDTDLVSITAIDQHWIVQDWMPRAIAAGLRTAASIKPRAYFGQTSVNRILSFVPVGLMIQSFENPQGATAWLRSVCVPGTYRIAYRRFKQGDPINTFEFWCQEPSIGYFTQLARIALRGFWRVDRSSLEPVIPRQPLPEMIVIESETGEEVCRWSLEDEMRQLEKSQQSS
jgi:hypothetical protein